MSEPSHHRLSPLLAPRTSRPRPSTIRGLIASAIGPLAVAGKIGMVGMTGIAGMGAAVVGLLPGPAHAQSGAEELRAYDIPPGPLDAALSRFGAEAGLLLSFSAETTQGRHSPGLSGRHSVESALAALLSGTGLRAQRQANGSYTLVEVPKASVGDGSPAGAAASLPAVRVRGAALKDGVTEGSGSYAARTTSTATGLDLSPRETPQTITVITRQQMDDFAMTSVNQVLSAASGVFVYDEGANGTQYYSRGFLMQSQIDGLPNPIGISNNNRNPVLDNAFLDRLEVLQGASGLLSGSGDPGGTINLVRKRPTDQMQAHAELMLGSWDQRRIVGDVSTPLLESGRLRGRLVAVAEDRNSFVDFVRNRRRGLYGVLEADVSASTLVSASFQYQRDSGLDQLGVPFGPDGAELGLPRSSFFGNARSGGFSKENRLYTVGITQSLGADWRLKASYLHSTNAVDQRADSWMWGDLDVRTGDGLDWYQSRSLRRSFRSDGADIRVSGGFNLLGRRHELVFGVNGWDMREDSLNTGNVPHPINVYSFDPDAMPDPTLGNPFVSSGRTRQYGAYAVGRLQVTEQARVILGSRVSWYESRQTSDDTTTRIRESGVISPYAGLVYDLNKTYSVYASYSDIFNPQMSSRQFDGSYLKPVVGANYEIGLKGDMLDGRLNVAAALFRLEQTNLPRRDDSVPFDADNACRGYCYVAADKVVSQGADLSAMGEILPGWHVAAGYTYVNSRYAAGEDDGQRYMTTLPQHSVRLSTSYRVPGLPLTVGANVRAFSRIYNEGPSYTIRRGGMALYGLSARYQFNRQADVVLVAENIFDRSYRGTVDSLYYTPFGEPRRMAVNLRYRF